MELVTFKLGEANFGLPIGQVKEVVATREVTHLPGAPAHIAGAVELRGQVISVLDLGQRLGENSGGETYKYIIVAERGQDLFGILIGDISQVMRVPEDMLVPPPEAASSLVERVVRTDGRMVLVLDVFTLVDEHEVRGVLPS